MSFLQRLRSKLWPSNDVYLGRTDEVLDHLKRVEGALGTMRREQDQLRNTVRTLDTQLKRLTSMQEYCATLVRTQSTGAILLAGWYGADNLGDELMLRTLVDYAPADIRSRLWVLTWQNASYDYEYLNELGVRTVRYPRSTEEASLLADSFDAIIWGGGAILDDKQYTDKPTNINTGNLFIRLNEYLLARGKHVFAIGLSTNWTFESADYVKRLDRIIQGADSFSVRDELSLEALNAGGVDISHVTICPDIVFGNRQLRQMDHTSPDTLTLGFVPMYIKDMHATNALILEALIEKASQQGEGARVRLIPFYRSGDASHFKSLREQCSRPDLVDIEPYSPDVASLGLRDCSAVVCSRYHAALVAGILGTPFLCVYPDMHVHYRNKCRYLSEAFACTDAFVPASGITSETIRAFVDGPLAATTGTHPFFEDAQKAIDALWKQVARI